MADAPTQCPECQSDRLRPGALPGILACQNCGKVIPGQYVVDEPEDEDRVVAEGNSDVEAVEGIEVPDLIEVQHGWRAWGVKPLKHPAETPLLRSVTHKSASWTPRAAMKAVCDKTTGRANGVKRKGHEVPAESCTCGLYSAKTYEHLMSMRYHTYDAEKRGMFHVVGKVKLWGKVIEGSQGWRAEIGYPETLYVPFEAWSLVKPLEDTYGVPVKLKNILRKEGVES